MIAIGIAVFVFIQLIVLLFAIALCRSAATADKEFERARMDDWRRESDTAGQAGVHSDKRGSTASTHARGVRSAARVQNR